MYAAGARCVGVRARALWALAALVGLGPMIGYVLTRTTGPPSDSDDVGNWSEPTSSGSYGESHWFSLTSERAQR
jgi:hypothetical protein